MEAVHPGSPADRAGIKPGDRLIAIDNTPVRDLLDYRFRTSGEPCLLTFETSEGKEIRFRKPAFEEVGVEFASELFDRVRICNNNCPFCFIYQLPKGMRPSLYIKDDDYRLSFMYGNYITLTNLTEEEFERICQQRISPLYVSIHATIPEVRARLLGNPQGGDILTPLRRLIKARIQVHCQIVFCPTINDREVLDQTLTDLAQLYPGTRSVAIVPVAMGKHVPEKRRLPTTSPELARYTIRQVHRWQKEFLKTLGTRFAFLADEFYFLAGEPIPGYASYEGFPQLEDGIGLVRLLWHQWRYLRRTLPQKLPLKYHITLITGALGQPAIAPVVTDLKRIENLQVDTLVVPNRFFGESITVTGLLTGQDILTQCLSYLETQKAPQEWWIPEVTLRDNRFLDDLEPRQIESTTGIPVRIIPTSAKGLGEAVKSLA